MPTNSSFTESNDVPGNALETDPGIVPDTVDPTGPTSPANPDMIDENITTGVQANTGDNAPLGTPATSGGPSSVPESVLNLGTANDLQS